MTASSPQADLSYWAILIVVIGILIGAMTGTLIAPLTRGVATSTTAVAGAAVGAMVIFTTVAVIWVVLWTKQDLCANAYVNAVAWFVTGIILGSLVVLVTIDRAGIVSAAGFVAGSIFMSVALTVCGWATNGMLSLGVHAFSFIFLASITAMLVFLTALVVKLA